MIEVFGPDKLANNHDWNLERCVKYINKRIESSYGPIVMIDLEKDNLPFNGLREDIVTLYTNAGWSEAKIEERPISGPEAEEYLHPPYREHLILTR